MLSVKRGTVVTLGFVNKSPAPQLMHVHGHALRHIHLFDDGWEPYWRDSIIVTNASISRRGHTNAASVSAIHRPSHTT